MKLLLIFLLTFQAWALTFDQIDAIDLDRLEIDMIYRILVKDIEKLPEGAAWISSRNPITLHPDLSMPSDSDILAEFNKYKDELRVVEQARLDEIERIEALKLRWEAIGDTRLAITECKRTDRNPAILIRDIIKNDDDSLMQKLEKCGDDSKGKQKEKKDKKKSKDLLIKGLINKMKDGTITRIDQDQLFKIMVERMFPDE